jgi:twinkle protein
LSQPLDASDWENIERLGNMVSRKAELHGAPASAWRQAVDNLWEAGLPSGEKTGWPAVDNLYTVALGQLTIVTGWPSSGKSEWTDALLLNLARQGWRHCVFSPENFPIELHVSKLAEKYLGKPFGEGLRERMSRDELGEAVTDIEDWFSFITPLPEAERTAFTVHEILDAAEVRFRMMGLWNAGEAKKGLVIDPWNELDHSRGNMSETEYTGMMLGHIRWWARRSRTHVWIVAHPQKVPREQGKLPIPRPDMISGSQHWWNKADCCVTVFRDFEKPDGAEIDVHVQKCRFRHIGKIGYTTLRYERATGRYFGLPAKITPYHQRMNEL